MIIGAHTIMYAADADRARAFLRDVLGLPHIDAGQGWLIFRSPPAELAVHPSPAAAGGILELYLMCDDLEATIEDLRAKGVEFTSEIIEQQWGRLITLAVPGAADIGLYEPRHPTAYDLE
ncbi:VOC family protein [Nocardia nova]|uniref:VOC family protein n=1 Tax=Nocardia nova TaxID=37330 RepID=UPI0033E0F582